MDQQENGTSTTSVAEQVVRHVIQSDGVENQRPLKVEVERNSRGYNYTVSYRGHDADDVIAVVRETLERVRAEVEQLD